MADGKTGANPVSMQRRVSVEFIKNSGNFAVRAPRGEKNPGKDWDPKSNSKLKSEQVLFEAESGEFNLGVHFFGNLVDVDVDTEAPFLTEALDIFLPSCAHVWGRPGKPRSHRAYMLKQDEPFEPSEHFILKRLDTIPEAKVEIRGGAQSRGEYSLLPGSVHPSGEPYEWSDLGRARNSLSVATIDQLIRGVRLAGAIAVIGPLWTEGIRNNLIMALSGFLFRAHSIAETIGGDAFSLDKAQAERFIEVLLDVTDDAKADRHSRMKTFNATWKKADDGVAVTGMSTLADIVGDRSVITKLYTLLTDSPDIAAIEEFTARFAIWQGPGLVVDVDQAKKGATKPLMTRQNFVNSFGHKFIEVGGKRKLLPDLLFHLESTTRVAGLTFQPGDGIYVDTREGKKINQWSGFATKPHSEPVPDKEVQRFIDYVNNTLASKDDAQYRWIMGWFADILQDPANKCRTSLVLVGPQGAGKSFAGAEILMPIIGEAHSASTKSVESITRGFNALFDNKIFVQCDEAMNNRQKATAAKLKSIITDPWIEVEPKGVDPYFKPNHMRLMFTSNDEEDAINLEDGSGDRRYTIIKVDESKVNKVDEYWLPFLNWVRPNLPKIMRWLLDYKYDKAFISWPLKTEAKNVMQQHSWGVFDAWLATWLARDHPLADATHEHWFDAPALDERGNVRKEVIRQGWPAMVSNAALARDLAVFSRAHGKYERPLNEVQIGANLIKRGLRRYDEARVRLPVRYFDERKRTNVQTYIGVYPATPPEKIAEYLQKKYGFIPESVGEIDELKIVAKEKTEF